jgi:hypothetical protein
MEKALRVLVVRPFSSNKNFDLLVSSIVQKSQDPNLEFITLPFRERVYVLATTTTEDLTYLLSPQGQKDIDTVEPEVLLVWNSEAAVEEALARFPSIKWIQNIFTGCNFLLKEKLIHSQ